MKILVFDTETTGLINKKEKDLEKQPHLVQFAAIVGEIKDGNFIELERINQLIKPPIPIPDEASQVHHIYMIDVKDAPSIKEKLPYFCELIGEVDIVVGHNISFDIGVLQIEINRLKMKGVNIDFQPKKTFCTMEESINYCRLPKKSGKGFKRPKLQELVRKSLGTYFHGAHCAMIDVEWTTKAFVKLWNEGIFKLKEREQIGLFN